MRTVLFILFLISASKAEYNISCSNSPNTSLTFEPTEDKIDGRYKVEWCTKADENVTKWDVVLEYINSRTCINFPTHPDGSSHSRISLFVKINLNCTQVCFSTLLDLVFAQCYHIQTHLTIKNSTTSGRFYHYYRNIINNFTKEHFIHSEQIAHRESYDGGLVLYKWYLGYVPATRFTVDIWDNETYKMYNTSCTVGGEFESEVSCKASLPPGRCYETRLTHHAYWTAAIMLFKNISNLNYAFCESMPVTPVVSSSPMGEWPKVVGAAGFLLLGVVVYCVVRRRHLAAWQKSVRENWLKTTPKESSKPANVDGNILLLYARDCAAFKCAAERLGALVHRATGCRVIDVYSGASTRLWAPGGDAWLRLILARDDTRVLLLQSPAGTLLAAALAETREGPALVSPLMGSLVSWQRPHAGDALLSLALRQLAAAPPSAPYSKHYVANISDLGADMAPGVTPYRRYTLPETVVRLLRDLAPSLKLSTSLDLEHEPILEPGLEKAPDLGLASVRELERSDLEPLLQQFKEAAHAFTTHVRDHPNYLADELLFKS